MTSRTCYPTWRIVQLPAGIFFLFNTTNWSGTVLFISLSMNENVNSRLNNNGREKTERDVS